MQKKAILNCFIVSLLFSTIAPLFMISTFVPGEGAEVYSYTEEDYEKMKEMPPKDATNYTFNEVKTKKLQGVERITYMFSNPYAGLMYLRHVLLNFIPIFLATLVSCYINKKYH